MQTTNILSTLRLAEHGLAFFPMNPETKRPACQHGVKDATRDPGQLQRWFSRPGLVPAIATGEPSGVVVLDIDRQHDGAKWWQEFRFSLSTTTAWRTRSGGLHLMFLWAPGIRTFTLGKIGAGVELRSTGASAIYWPAIGFPVLCDAAPVEFPSWLLPPSAPPPAPFRMPEFRGETAQRRYVEAAMRNAITEVATAAPGTRNETLNRCTYGLLRLVETGGATAHEIAGAMAHAGIAAGLDAREVEGTLTSALRARGGVA